MSQLDTEVDRRKTFAIIAHPDAGKTTLTEKLLFVSLVGMTAFKIVTKAFLINSNKIFYFGV